MKKLILWDLDGTLIDTLEDLGAAVNHALSLRGLHPLAHTEYRKMVGHGVRHLVQQALESACPTPPDAAGVDAALADFTAYYSAHIDVYTRPYAEITELLMELRDSGIRMAVTSNKFQEGTERLVRTFFPHIPFVAVLGNKPGCPLKPSPEIVQTVLSQAAVAPEDALLVGDSPTDMRTAANGGIDAIAVSWGYRTAEELAGHRLISSVDALREELLK